VTIEELRREIQRRLEFERIQSALYEQEHRKPAAALNGAINAHRNWLRLLDRVKP